MALRWVVPGRLAVAGLSASEEAGRELKGGGTLVIVSSEELNVNVGGVKVERLNPELIYRRRFDELVEAFKRACSEEPLIFCCRSGMVAAPIAAAAYLVFRGWSAGKAVEEVSSRCGGVVAYSSVRNILEEFEEHIKRGRR